MTPLARRIVAVVAGVLVLAVVVLVLSVSPGPTARAGLIVLGAGLVVIGVITAVMVRWFRRELAETNRSTAVEVMSEAGVDPEDLEDGDRSEGEAGPASADGTLPSGDAPGDADDRGPDDRRDARGGR